MSYDIFMVDPKTELTLKLDESHHFKGGTYVLGGTTDMSHNITYNYSEHYYKLIDKEQGIRWIYGKTGKEVLSRLKGAVKMLGTKRHDDYWENTKGNAGNALLALIAFCEAKPDGIFEGD